MSYHVVACDNCKVLLFDPEIEYSEVELKSCLSQEPYMFPVTKVHCPVCKEKTECTQIDDLSDL